MIPPTDTNPNYYFSCCPRANNDDPRSHGWRVSWGKQQRRSSALFGPSCCPISSYRSRHCLLLHDTENKRLVHAKSFQFSLMPMAPQEPQVLCHLKDINMLGSLSASIEIVDNVFRVIVWTNFFFPLCMASVRPITI